jgi:uncharacterized membrane protein YcaP (DUF421 family)
MDPQDLLLTALRASFIYLFLLLVVRILGKREVGNTSAFDLIVALMLGEVVPEIIYGDVSIVKGMIAIVTIAAWHLVNSWGTYHSKIIQKLTSAQPTVLVEAGKIKQDALAKERMHPEELFAEMRLMEIDDIKEVKTATLEPNGKVSVLKEDWAKTVQKQDVFEEKAKAAEKSSKAAKKEIADSNKKIQNPEQTASES